MFRFAGRQNLAPGHGCRPQEVSLRHNLREPAPPDRTPLPNRDPSSFTGSTSLVRLLLDFTPPRHQATTKPDPSVPSPIDSTTLNQRPRLEGRQRIYCVHVGASTSAGVDRCCVQLDPDFEDGHSSSSTVDREASRVIGRMVGCRMIGIGPTDPTSCHFPSRSFRSETLAR